MKSIAISSIIFAFALYPVSVLSDSCSVISKAEKDKRVHVVLKGTPKGDIKGKVVEVNTGECVLVISTDAEYRTYYLDATNIAALGIQK